MAAPTQDRASRVHEIVDSAFAQFGETPTCQYLRLKREEPAVWQLLLVVVVVDVVVIVFGVSSCVCVCMHACMHVCESSFVRAKYI
jgi:hypothetical protein